MWFFSFFRKKLSKERRAGKFQFTNYKINHTFIANKGTKTSCFTLSSLNERIDAFCNSICYSMMKIGKNCILVSLLTKSASWQSIDKRRDIFRSFRRRRTKVRQRKRTEKGNKDGHFCAGNLFFSLHNIFTKNLFVIAGRLSLSVLWQELYSCVLLGYSPPFSSVPICFFLTS